MKTVLLLASLMLTQNIFAQEKLIYRAETKGTFMKDFIKVFAFQDPDYPVVCYYSTYVRKFVGGTYPSSSTQISCHQTEGTTKALVEGQNLLAHGNQNGWKDLTLDRVVSGGDLVYVLYTKGIPIDEEKASGDHGLSVVTMKP